MSNTDRKTAFRGALVDLVNEHIRARGLTPEEAAAVFAEEGGAALEHLGWKPHPQRAASEHFTAAAACLNEGRVIPVPGFDTLFPSHAGSN